MKQLLLSLLLCVSTSVVRAEVQSSSLDDVMTPDELANEVGAPRTEMHGTAIDPDKIKSLDGIDVFREYQLVLRINKSASGPAAQKIQVIENGNLTYTWPVSTGREQWETAKSGRSYFTTTPVGTFTPQRLERDHWSETWKAHMEFAVFFNGGVAVHATTPDHYKQLGTRASGGCVRLHRENAEYIYGIVSAQTQSLVPVFNRDGRVARDRKGHVIREMGYSTLIIVEE